MIDNSQIQKLLSRIALHDDAAAYKKLFILYHSKLVSFSASITHSKESAEEIVSDVFLKIWTKRATLTTIKNFHLYIYIVARNYSINHLLKHKNDKVFSFDDSIIEIQSIYLDPEQMMLTAEMFKRVRNAIQSLPPKCQLIFKLVKEDGLKYREVAELLDLSHKTVENQMSIALKKIAVSIPLHIPKTSLN